MDVLSVRATQGLGVAHQASGGEEERAEVTAEICALRSRARLSARVCFRLPWLGQISPLGCSLTCTEDASVPGWAGRG